MVVYLCGSLFVQPNITNVSIAFTGPTTATVPYPAQALKEVRHKLPQYIEWHKTVFLTHFLFAAA